jgi:hypothetical protein
MYQKKEIIISNDDISILQVLLSNFSKKYKIPTQNRKEILTLLKNLMRACNIAN